jgi:PTS system cellobiose-specific IIA component
MGSIDKEELISISMEVILHAGNARNLVFQAVNKASESMFEEADQLITDANAEVTIAHRAQTNMLQKEAEGIDIPYSPLFGHAQDTLMTVKTEINMMQEMIKLYKKMKG